MMLQRIDAGGGDDAGLAQRAAHTLLPGPGFEDQFPAAGEDRAEWTSEPLAEVEPEGIEGFGEIQGGHAGRDDGVEDARAVHVPPPFMPAGDPANGEGRLPAPTRRW